jgi:hypothetical protein
MRILGKQLLKLNFLVLTKIKHGSLHPYLNEGKQLAPNGHLKSRQKLMAQLTNTMFLLLLVPRGYY